MGGGVMRTAAKVGMAAGAAAAASKGGGGRFRPAFAAAPGAAEAAPLVSAPAAGYAGGQWSPSASWEVDDWEFADWRDEAAAAVAVVEQEAAPVKPRLVFAPPSREEAEEATTELRDAIERGYFNEAPVEAIQGQDKELNKLGADAIIPAMPGHVLQAFTLLKSSPEAQSVVASLASDRNVWDAVMKNDKVMEFYRTHQPTVAQTFPEESATVETPEKFGDTSHEEQPTGSPFMDFVDNAAKSLKEIFNNITYFFQDFFRNPEEAQAGGASSAGKGPSFAERAAGGSFMALTIAVILVVLFKRA